jgi:uncharacterized protein YejL (UPF0352 family)
MNELEKLRAQAAISFMAALLENTKHNVIEEPVLAETYSSVAVRYADALIEELNRTKK